MAEKDSVQIKKKLTEALPQYKFSVTRDDFAGGHSVRVNVISGPMEVFSTSGAREDANGYVEIFRDRYKDDERINEAIKPDIDKMYKIIYDIGQFPSGYHGGPYLHWRFGSYSKPYEVVASKKSMPAPRAEKSSGETNADSELLKTFSQGWSLFKTTINKKDYDGKPITLVVYNLNKNKDLKNIPYDKFLEFKGEMLTNLGMKWGKFQKFEKWTFPPDMDVLKMIIDKYYGVGESKEETPTPQPTPKSSKMSVKEIADRLMTLDSTTWDRLKIESGSKLYADDDLQKKYIKFWTEYYESDTAIPTKMKELSMTERNELGDYFEDDNYHALKNLLMLYGYFGVDNKKSAEEYYEKSKYGLNPKNFKPEEEELPFKEGDKFLLTINSGDTTLTILDVDEKDVKVQYADGSKGLFELDTAKSRVERGVWKKVLDEEKEGGSEEEIKKAIAALEILAEDGDEDARKGIEALKILLN